MKEPIPIDKAEIIGKEYSWNHSISEVLNALINAGLEN